MAKTKHLVVGGSRDGYLADVDDVLLIEWLILPRIGTDGRLDYEQYRRHDFGTEVVFAAPEMSRAEVMTAIMSHAV